jgi:hypothetical protein
VPVQFLLEAIQQFQFGSHIPQQALNRWFRYARTGFACPARWRAEGFTRRREGVDLPGKSGSQRLQVDDMNIRGLLLFFSLRILVVKPVLSRR